MMKKSLLAVVVVASILTSWCVTGNAAEMPRRGGTLIIATEKDPHGLDTHKDVAVQGINILPQIYDSLINIDDEGKLVPGLAISIPSQPDPVTYVFTLRKGVKFHNGASFDAQDVKFSFDRLMNKEISLYWKTNQDMIKSVEVLEPYKIKITLKSPNLAFLDMMAKYHEFQIVPRGTGADIKNPIGTGPFKFKEWTKDDRLVLVKNEQYWDKGFPYLDQIIYKPFPEETTRALNFKTGAVDLIHNLPIVEAVQLKKDPSVKVLGRSGGMLDQVWLNTCKPPFDNKKVRQAVAFGIDRQAIAESVFMGFSEIAHNLCPSWFWAYNPNIRPYSYDPEKAKNLLKEAGYTPDNPLTFTISCTNEQIFIDQAVIIQAQLSKIGVKVNVLPLEKSYWFDGNLGRMGRDFEASLNHSSDDMTDLQWFQRYLAAKSYYNYTGYNSERYGRKGAQNPDVERLFSEIEKSSDKNFVRKTYDRVQALVLDDMPIYRLGFIQNLIAMKGYVKNHKILTRNTVPLKAVWIEK